MAYIDAHRDRFGVESICRALPIAPSTYHRHRLQQAEPTRRSARARRDDTLRPEIQRADPFDNAFAYVMRDDRGTVVEHGTVQLEALAKPLSMIDFVPAGSTQRRRGVYSILDGTMQLDYGMP